jgi:uncharacterized DUF497 family protein
MDLTFEWDENKSDLNFKKHEIYFEEAKTVFNDPLSITIQDKDHSVGENRYIDIGCSIKGRILIVIYSERNNNIRIISCRKATKHEIREYEKDE